MTTTRSSARNNTSSTDKNGVAGAKRKADTTEASPKRDRKAPKKQSTIDESLGVNQEKEDEPKDIEMKEAADEGEGTKEDQAEAKRATNGTDDKEQKQEQDAATKDKEEADDKAAEEPKADTNGDGAIENSSQREKKMPSNILEKGLIYFFTRNRVNVDEAESVGDLSRTYFVLRPLPKGAKLTEGAVQDLENNRLFALPKKIFPKSHSDRFMAFVEKANTTVKDLKENFFAADEYETKTSGTRRTEPVTPIGEGVYAITRTEDRTTHLAYMVTIPSELGEVQKDLGLREQGSFVISVKNPERPGPVSTRLPQGPDFPKEVIEEFRGLAWAEVKPKYLDYSNCQILLIGEHTDKAVEQTTKEKKHDTETPKEALEELEHEDELRTQHLHGDDSVFDDLKISKKEYSEVPTTW